jgi:hypothetical protein
MTTLEKLTEELTETEKTAALDPEELPPADAGRLGHGHQRGARTRLETLRAQYKARADAQRVAIFVDGDQAKVGRIRQAGG